MKAMSLRACWLALFLGAAALIAVPTVADAQAKKETAPAKKETAPAKKEKQPAMTTEQKKAKSKECSELADKRNLHGKERRNFRSKCKRGTAT